MCGVCGVCVVLCMYVCMYVCTMYIHTYMYVLCTNSLEVYLLHFFPPIVADDMGLGKTLSLLALVIKKKQDGGDDKPEPAVGEW